MQHWLTALAQAGTDAGTDPAILVTVAAVRGSTPRETGAKMIVTGHRQFDTIGGGHLELRAAEIARDMLRMAPAAEQAQRRLERFALAASLGQCCGGVVHLAFERINANSSGHVRQLQQRWQAQLDSWRLVALDLPLAPALCQRDGTPLPAAAPLTPAAVAPELPAFDPEAPCHVLQDPNGRRWLVDPCLAWRAHLYLFGAGHVGHAVVRALADLPCHVTWVDQRDDLFPAQVSGNVRIEVTDTPGMLIERAPAGSHFLIMTHSHPLDQELVEAVLRRDDARWLGLIGSHSKRLQFERRLRAHGIGERQLASIVCPIGIPGIPGKAPAVIAVAVAAQLLQVWHTTQPAAGGSSDLPSAAC